ncbi:Vitamin B12 transporter BtuB [Vibrio stylophorae]|uniref:Vitamin B12 transporter BtuB n=1 Tax=Vibrio stylophorae TaxID=659351 RepID=A0ABM8ZPX2_9VIBR|nr:TonB-dependent receptor [Vibrio stylophorae]CAH0532353.1 Vitamin B12 transporter BtuB [Vibrio stylophorae]
MNQSKLAVALVSLLPFSASYAQSTDENTIVVTANRFEQPKDSVIASSDVITKEQIERLQFKTLTDALKWLPGIQVTNSGGLGQSSSVFVRGGATSHLIVLVNGVRIGSATLGEANFTAIPLTGVEKIEVIRGARAAVYGADAISGVINIITDAGFSETNAGLVNLGLGSDQYYQGSASGYLHVSDDSWIKAGVNLEKSNGFNVTDQNYAPQQPDKDGFHRQDLSLELGKQFNANWTGRVSGFYHDGQSEYDGYSDWKTGKLSPVEQKTKLYNIAAQAEYQSESWYSSLTIAQNRDESIQVGGEFPGSTIVTERFVTNWLNSYELSNNFKVLGGVEYSQDSVADSNLYNSDTGVFQRYDGEKRNNTAVYASSIAQIQQLALEASLRYDNNDVYGDYTTWQLGVAYDIAQALRVFASAGTAFKTPTYNDLYWPGYGNPNLKPEESLSYEAGFEAYSNYGMFRVAAYRNEIDNLISYQGQGVALESSNATINGIEITAQFDTGPLSHSVSVDLLDSDNPVNVAGWNEPPQLESKELSRRAEAVYKWLISYQYNQFQADLAYMYQGERFDDTKNTTKLDAYSLVDFALSYDINANFIVQGKVTNLFDEEYQTAYTYNTQERAYYLNAQYRF